jgi:DNA invertase Pin-like site-specific DNA recombinase
MPGVFRTCLLAICACLQIPIARAPTYSATRCWPPVSTSATLFEDHAPGAKDDRRGLISALAFVRAGDVLVVWKLDRLGRSCRTC